MKDGYCNKRKTFDKLNRKFSIQKERDLQEQLNSNCKRDFWRSIGKFGVANERTENITWDIVNPDGTVNTDRGAVLNTWRSDFETLYARNDNIDDLCNLVNEEDIYELSPEMFAIYINDLVECINNLQCGIRIGDDLVSILLYADDIALIAPDKDSLQKMLDVVSDWCSQWKLDVIDRSMWLDEHLTFDKAVRELSKSASRALGALYGKFISAGGMTHSVYSKLYSTMVEPVLFYCSGIWGTKVHSVINSIQNKAAKFFMSVGRYTANTTAIRGDMGWTSCFTKQRTACIRLLSRILRSDDTRLTRKITEWTKNRRKGWYVKVKRFAETVDATAILNDTLISTKTVMRTIKERFDVVDNDEFKQALFDDSNNSSDINDLCEDM
ncbi:Hypothetical predicted protein [Mytilus galloprovincialis]|uniref:Reverse transcriptase domain-containing protein n=1 Tax=Mytilus galloprovincialis TaxID=29158 RepID=A0A8B6DNZ8_MYTGA|nr:Hypothetical predicted protein [Mytilus galloprovincialis]